MGTDSADSTGTVLIGRIAQGDSEAFWRFYDAYAGLAFGLIQRVLRDRASAEEMLQEVFRQVWREAATCDPRRGSPEAWPVVRARARAIDRLRAARRRDRMVAAADERSRPTDARLEQDRGVAVQERDRLHAALERLPPPQRQVIELAFFEGLSQSEIAARLGAPLGTVKTRGRMGLERLRTLLEPEGLAAP
jgi:RNA polymerase sigma-70 factor, ECF subfamily